MTSDEFVEAIRAMHEPYIPRVLNIKHDDPTHPEYNGGEWHEPSVSEQASALIWMCDGCSTLAEHCRVAHLLVLVSTK